MSKRPNTDLTSWPEGALRGLARHAERPEVRTRAIIELDRRARPPWLSGAEKIIAIVNVVAVAGLVAVALWLSGCSFVEEGTGAVGCEDCYRPPRFPGAHIDPAPPDASTDGGESSSGDASADEERTTGGQETDSESSAGQSADTGQTTGGQETDESGSSSTGDEPYEPAHCDMTCPAGDALEPNDEQVGGTFQGCYCATPCDSDDDCAPLEHCEPQFGRCTIACMSDAECALIGSPPGAMACTLWWNSADEFTHYCAYWNEDAP